jgi:hypothetical protein
MEEPNNDPYRRWRAFIALSKWTFAKTYAKKAPHEYTVLKSTYSPETFRAFVQFIWDHGYKERFWRREFTYIDIDGWKYWTMDPTVESTDLINRARIKDT